MLNEQKELDQTTYKFVCVRVKRSDNPAAN